MLPRLPTLPRVTGGHLLRTETPNAAPTTEKIRGDDAVADWVLVVSGYAIEALAKVAGAELGATA